MLSTLLIIIREKLYYNDIQADYMLN